MSRSESIGDVPSSREVLLQRFRNLHEYLYSLGEHVNLINNSLERIEKNISEMRTAYKLTLESNENELEQLREYIVAKTEVDSLLQELNEVIKGAFPLLSAVSKQAEKEQATSGSNE